MTAKTSLSLADVEAEIASEWCFTAAQGAAFAAVGRHDLPIPEALHNVTFCVLVLRNGTKVAGVNYGSIDPALFDPVRAREMARANAIEQVWPLMGYELRSRLLRRSEQGCAP